MTVRSLHRVALSLVATALLLPAAATAQRAAGAPPLDAPDLAEAMRLEERIRDNLWFGQVFEVDYRTPERILGDLANVNHFGDSALWTGTYLAAESFRYTVAKQRSEDPFWLEQMFDAKARIDEMVAKFHMLINISKNWDYEFEPSLDPPGFGGGVFHGEPGYLMRACVPTDAEPWQTWNEPRGPRVFGPLKWDDGKEYYCEDATSRDAYAGTTFGLLTAFDLVSPDDAAMRAQIRDDVITMTAFAFKYAWNTPRPHGNISLPPEDLEDISPVDIWGHDFENFISPLFVYVPLARLNMAQGARHVARAAGTPEQAALWEGVWTEELLTQGPLLALSMEIDSMEPNSGYYKYNLHHLTAYNVSRLELDPVVQLLIKQAIGVMDNTTGDDVNAHFETITYGLTGEPGRLDDAITHLREWRAYRANVEGDGQTVNSSRCGADVECVPEDQWDAVISTPAGAVTVVTKPGTATRRRARTPLPVADRAPTDFLWQRPPTQLDGAEGTTHQAPGVDYLLPYWMIRYLTEVAPPALAPFPAWPGPSHR